MSQEKINYNILTILLSDCKYSKNYKVVELDDDIVCLERNNSVKFPFDFKLLVSELITGGNKQLGKYIENKFIETINLPY